MEAKYCPKKGADLKLGCFVGSIRTWVIKTFVLFLLGLESLSCIAQDRSLGVNLTDVSPFGTLWYYTNALKQSSGWLVYHQDDEGDPINLSNELTSDLHLEHFDSEGYPLQIPFESNIHPELEGKSLIASCLVLNGQPEPFLYPAGIYQLSFEGSGVIAIQGDVDGEYMEFTLADDYSVPITRPSTTGLQLFILSSDAADPIRNVSLIFPGYHERDEVPKFQDAFLDLAAQFDVLRFMKPLKSENNTIVDFEDRSIASDFSYFIDTENEILPGMPYEDVVEISHASGSDPWITIPYLASDDYVRATAEVFSQLCVEQQVYVEYSNETWNPAYPETRAYMLEMGIGLATSNIPEVAEFEAIHRYHAFRSLEIWRIFEETLEESAQLVRVHGSQSDPYTADLVRDAYDSDLVNPEGQQPDMIAIAAYIGVTLFDDLREQNIDICDHTPQQLLDTLMNRIAPELNEMVSRFQVLFGSSAIEVVAYEGGQHVTELNFRPMDPCAATLVAEMNRLPGMTSFFCELLDTWYETYDGGLFNLFNLAEAPDDFGAFGLLESQWQNGSDSPKWRGIFDCELPLSTNEHDVFELYPNPVHETLYIRVNSPLKYQVLSVGGRIIGSGNLKAGNHQIDLERFSPGVYLFKSESSERSLKTRILIKSSK